MTNPKEEKVKECSEHSPPGCTYSFLSTLECTQEIVDGQPVKRCSQILRRFRQCPNEEPRVDESKQDITTYQFETDEFMHPSPPPALQQTEPEAAGVGQALEEVIRLAEDLQEGFAPRGGSVRLDTPPAAMASPSPSNYSETRKEEGLLSRLFKSRRDKQPLANERGKKEPLWSNYAKDYEDV